jgi:hypothetical protein
MANLIHLHLIILIFSSNYEISTLLQNAAMVEAFLALFPDLRITLKTEAQAQRVRFPKKNLVPSDFGL